MQGNDLVGANNSHGRVGKSCANRFPPLVCTTPPPPPLNLISLSDRPNDLWSVCKKVRYCWHDMLQLLPETAAGVQNPENYIEKTQIEGCETPCPPPHAGTPLLCRFRMIEGSYDLRANAIQTTKPHLTLGICHSLIYMAHTKLGCAHNFTLKEILKKEICNLYGKLCPCPASVVNILIYSIPLE